MKNFNTLQLVLFFVLVSIHANGQILDKKVTIQFQNITLSEAIKKIKTTYQVNFSYCPDQIDLNQKYRCMLKA